MKNYVVVGGSSGIGLAITKNLSEKGHNVYVVSRTADKLAGLDNVFHMEIDITKEVNLENLPDQVHGLAYCPGTINLKPFHRIKPEAFQEDWEINVMGAIKVIQSAIKKLKAGEASIVLFSTVAAKLGMPFHASVAASKSALEGLAKTIAAEYAPVLRCNVVAPSLTDTPLAERLLSTDQKRESSAERHPLKRVGTADDIANMAVYLMSEEGSFITGQVLGVDGGMGSTKI